MKKKPAKKVHRTKSQTLYSRTSFRFLVITTIAALFILGTKTYLLNTYQPDSVLGASTFIVDSTDQNSVGQDSQGTRPPDFQAPAVSGVPNQPPSEQNFQGLPSSVANMENLNKVEFQTENGHAPLRIQNGDLNIEMSTEGGTLNIKAKDANGNEQQLRENSLEKINNVLNHDGIEIGSSSANEITLRKGNVEAQTHFPLSIDPATNTLTVTTPAGVKNVAVLPDQAVQNLLQQRIIDSVSNTAIASNGATLQQVTLGLLNNTPAFQVVGVANKKLFGFFPIGVDKTSYVSAQNGQVLQTNESFISQIFDLLSTQ
jgi:hypothetical protein